jgi:lantibiotic biosynthesis protein
MRAVFTAHDTALARIPLGAALPGPDAAGYERALLREAVFLAARHVRPLAAPGDSSGRLECTWHGYDIRLRERATPHGVFAGVAAASFVGTGASLCLGRHHRVRTTPSASWLAAVADQAIGDPAVLAELTLTTSPLAVRRGARYYSEQRGNGSARPLRSVSVRASAVTTYVVQTCGRGAPGGEILAGLRSRWPSASPELLVGTLASLIRAGILLHDLIPEDPREDPLGRLLAKLPGCSPVRGALARLRGQLASADDHPPASPDRLRALISARDTADQIVRHDRPLRADLAADADIRLPQSLADEAAEAAGLLWRIGWGTPPLEAWHAAFVERYGSRRWVPLLEATDPVTGLGTADDADTIGPPVPDQVREAALARLLATALADGSTEVTLAPPDVAELTARDGYPPPRTAEIYVRVLAASPADLAAGRFSLAVCPGGGSQDAGSTAGRFTALLDGTWQPSVACPAGAVVAELAVLPRTWEGASVSPVTGLASYRIPVGLPARCGDLIPESLLLGSSGEHLIVWSSQLRRPVIPVLYSRLAAGLLPPLARFLSLAGQAGARPWHGWSWRTSAPFTPAVRYRRTWLAAARWTLPPALIRAAGTADWESALDAWRYGTRPAPPQRVVTDDSDRHLPLDLNQQSDRDLLRRYVRRGLTAVTGAPGMPAAVQAILPGPRGQHLLELAVSVYRSAPPSPMPHPPPEAVRAGGAGLYLPGQDWLTLVVPAHPACQDQILAALRPVAATAAGYCDRWFWLRYRDAAHGTHLRVRFHGQPEVLASRVLPALTSWGVDLRRQGLSAGFSIIPYEQETERYGGPDVISAAEAAFCADSDLVLDLLAATSDEDQRLLVAGVSAAAIACCLASGPGQIKAAVGGRQLDRAGRARALRLRPAARQADPGDGAGLPAEASAAWDRRQRALRAYQAVLPADYRAACASDLIHLHCNRMVPGTATELVARAIAADLLAATGRARPAP